MISIVPNEDHFRMARDICKLRSRPQTLIRRLAIVLAELDARIRQLQSENFALASDQCHSGYGDDFGHHRCKYQDRICDLENKLKGLGVDLDTAHTKVDEGKTDAPES